MKQFRSIKNLDKKDLFFKDQPFLATARENSTGRIISGNEIANGGQVTFVKGKVFQCYNNEDNQGAFGRGAKSHFPKNISETFDFQIGDKFYLSFPDGLESPSEIVKVEEGGKPTDGGILIWETWERDKKYGYTQYLSDHVYLQNTEEYREMAFKHNLIEEKENGSKRYKMNGGWVFINNGTGKDSDVSEYIPSFEYTLKSGQNRYFYIQLDAQIFLSETQQWHDANRTFIQDAKILDAKDQKDQASEHGVQFEGEKVKLIYSKTPITKAQIVLNRPYVAGKPCAKTKKEKKNQEVRDHNGVAYNFEGKSRERVYENVDNSGRMWYQVGEIVGNVELILSKKNASTFLNFGRPFDFSFRPLEANTNADITHVCYTSSSPVPSDACTPPHLDVQFDYLTVVTYQEDEDYGEDDVVFDVEIIGVSDTIKYQGNGFYEVKCSKIPKNRTVILDENTAPAHSISDDCEYQRSGLGDYFKKELTTFFKSRTSELVLENYR